ncbi:hypothetical protein SDC9_42736 [bioreactor metagenome]|uniref:Uncharacterized protein n=1 Tax=bioreactor metagenome TaxID=1076179 RepID=A0A644VYJ0_9ZZZZ
MRRAAKVVRLMRSLCNEFLLGVFRVVFSCRLHAVHDAHVTVDDADALLGGAGMFFAAFADLNPTDEQPQDFRCQLRDFRIPLGF